MNPPVYTSLARDRARLAPAAPTLLMYHKLGLPPFQTNIPALYVSPRGFRRQLDELLAAGVPRLAYSEAVAALRRGFAVTFDDGFANAFTHALPALAARGVRAIQFIVAGLIGRHDEWDHPIGEPPQRLMDDAQIRDWLAAGHEIGAHTMTHPRLADIPLAQARAEIVDAKRLLEDRFGGAIRHFCYPYGNYNPAVRDLVAEAGYVSACTIEPGVNAPGVDLFALHREMACDDPLAPEVFVNRILRRMRGKNP